MDHGRPSDIIAGSNDDGAGIARGAPKLSRRSTQLTKILPFRGNLEPGVVYHLYLCTMPLHITTRNVLLACRSRFPRDGHI